MKVFVMLLLMFVVFFAGNILYSTQESIILVMHFSLLYGLYASGEYIKKQLKRPFLDFPPDASIVFSKHGENLKNSTILLVLGTCGFGVNSLFMGFVKNDFEYFRTLLENCQENWHIALMIIGGLYVAYHLLWTLSFFVMWINAFCILWSFNYAPATPSNKKIIDELDAKMKKYLPSKY